MKFRFAFLTIAAVLFLTASSAWEGAGAVAPAGELPNEGFFIATNSFPRNTVVDLTNIETGRSTRAIVANTLNSPGLLAIVSREAAELIGMRQGSTSRIRIIQPADPIAYLRFMENTNPNFDPGTPINEQALLEDVYSEDTYNPMSPSGTQAQTTPAQTPPEQPAPVSITGPSYIMEPEWSGPVRMNVVDVPGYDTAPVEQHPRAENHPSQIAGAEPQVNSHPVNEYAGQPLQVVEQWRNTVYVTEREREDITKDVSERFDEVPSVSVDKEPNEFLAETDSEDVGKPASEFVAEELPRDEVIKDVVRDVYTAEGSGYNVVPSGEQPPPDSIYGINPNDIIPGVAVARPAQSAQTAPAPQTTAPAAIAVPAQPAQTVQEVPAPAQPAAQPTVPVTQAPVDYIPVPAAPQSPSAFEPPVQPSVPSVVTPPPANINSAVRRISQLERGQYYLQIAALPAESVNNALSRIDSNYNPGVFSDGSNLHRILIGPLNQGESAAILARFKSIGYRDAFVRRGS